MTSIFFRISPFLLLGFSPAVLAQPGTILFEDDFEAGLSATDWTISAGDTNNAGTNAYLVTTGDSMFTRREAVTVTSDPFDLSSVSGANLSMVMEKGADIANSEDPDAADEDFVLEYLDSDDTTWVALVTLDAQDMSPQEQVIYDAALPSAALHDSFQFRFRQTGGSGTDFDYWHVDDVELLETSGVVIPPPVLSANSCEYFENGLGNWTSSGVGNSGTSTATYSGEPLTPAEYSMFLNEDTVTVTSDAFDATSVTDLSVWIRKGDDSFSEDPEGNEDLVFEYSNNGTIWTELDTYGAQGMGALADGEIVTPSWTSPTDFTVSSTFQVRFRLLEGDGAGFDYWHIDDLCFDGGTPLPSVLKTVTVISDPINGTTNPKAIPNAILEYTIMVTNSGDGSLDAVTISDTLDPNATLFIGDLDGSGSPFDFNDGTGSDASGLAYDFFTLSSSGDSPTFYNSTPTEMTTFTPEYDPAVRSFDIELLGQMYPENTGTPEFTITYRVRLD